MTALVLQNGRAHGPFAIAELSADHVTLAGTLPPEVAAGAATVVLAGADGCLLRVPGHVLSARTGDRASAGWGIVFDQIDRELARRLDRWVADQRNRDRRPCVVVLDASGLGRSRLRRDISRLGRDVLFFETMLELLWFMEVAADEVGVVVVDLAFAEANGTEALAFVRERWPDKRCLLVCNAALDERQEARVRTLGLFTHGVLRRPWTERRLTVALGVHADPPSRRRLALPDVDASLGRAA